MEHLFSQLVVNNLFFLILPDQETVLVKMPTIDFDDFDNSVRIKVGFNG